MYSYNHKKSTPKNFLFNPIIKLWEIVIINKNNGIKKSEKNCLLGSKLFAR